MDGLSVDKQFVAIDNKLFGSGRKYLNHLMMDRFKQVQRENIHGRDGKEVINWNKMCNGRVIYEQ